MFQRSYLAAQDAAGLSLDADELVMWREIPNNLKSKCETTIV
jgi:hypothetical protein